jgi:hypothetical protein
MTNTTKITVAVITLGIIGVGAGVAMGMKKPKVTTTTTKVKEKIDGGDGSNNNGSSFEPPSGNQTYTPPATGNKGFPLKNGSRDKGYGNVTRLQNALQGLGKSITSDGIFGSKTEAALVSVTGKRTVDSESELQSIIDKQYAAKPDYDVLGLNRIYAPIEPSDNTVDESADGDGFFTKLLHPSSWF